MRILLINPPHPAIGSRIPREHLPPLGLLSIGGPLLDAGHQVRLLDGELGPLALTEIVRRAVTYAPQAVLIGHSGSTSGHPSVAQLTHMLRCSLDKAWIIYGGVFPSYHWREILADEPQINFIVRGEGEDTTLRLIQALELNTGLQTLPGIAYWFDGRPFATPPAPVIQNLDDYRVGWELANLRRYSYWGDRRAVVAQFSRGCPHTCNYCGQRGFWTRWRHRDPVKFAAELAWLYRAHGVEVIDFADETPTACRPAWLAFLEALIAENVPLTLVGSTRADDIVRDADILHLYKKAGVARFLLGLESYDENTLQRIRKGGATVKDREAIRLLRQHDILSMATYVVGFDEAESDGHYWRGLKQLLVYDPDQIQMLYATPHRWTRYYRQEAHRKIVQTDISKWDYKHQVLESPKMPSWRLIIWVKLIEAVMQLRPRSLRRLIAHREPAMRAAIRWYYRIGRKVWFYEIWNFIINDHREQNGPSLEEFWGEPQESEQYTLEPGNSKQKTNSNQASNHIQTFSQPLSPAIKPHFS
jgi:anaerobic magnesium-protoporphyrin IX monomethyl ester cyclase